MKRKVLFSLAVSFCLFSITSPAYAAELPDISITMSPATSRLNLEAGKTYESNITIVNDGQKDYDFLVYTAPYSMNTETYDAPDFLTKKPRSDLYSWLTLPQKKYFIKGGKKVEVPYTITVPTNTSPGGHYGVIFAEIQPSKEEQEMVSAANQVNRKKRVGTIFYSTVSGTVIRKGQLQETVIQSWQYASPLTVAQRVKNVGNTDFDVRYGLVIEDVFGRKKYQKENTFVVLPETTRLVQLQWEKSIWYGLYKVKTTTQFLNKKYSHEQYVLLLPIWMSFMIVVTGFGLVYAIYRRYYR